MNLHLLPLLVAGIAAGAVADRIPVLSEPRSIELGYISLDAWGDTLIAANWGKTKRIVRHDDEVILLDSIVDDSLRSEIPRTFQTGLGTHLQASNMWFNTLVWTQHVAAPVLVDRVNNGYSRVGGDVFHKGDTTFVFTCSATNSYLLQRIGAGPWTLRDADTLSGDSLQICSVDPVLQQTLRITYPAQRAAHSRFYTGNSSTILQRYQTDTLHFLPTTAFVANDNAILLYDGTTGTIRLTGTAGNHLFQPTELVNLKNSFSTPVRKDSLIIFGGDSTLVLALWVRNRFQVLQTIHLDGALSYNMAMGDSTLWVPLGRRTVSFRLNWQERATGVSPRKTALAPELARVRRLPKALEITWNGATETSLQVVTASGTVLAQTRLSPATLTRIPVSEQTGLLILRTPQGSRTIMVTK